MMSGSLLDVVYEYYAARGLHWPKDADTALQWALTELGEAHELLLTRKGPWQRNHPDAHPEKFDLDAFGEELGDVILMLMVAGTVEGIDPEQCLRLKIERTLRDLQEAQKDKEAIDGILF